MAIAAIALFAIAVLVAFFTLPLEGRRSLYAMGRFCLLSLVSVGGILLLDAVTVTAKCLKLTPPTVSSLFHNTHFNQFRMGKMLLNIRDQIKKMEEIFTVLLETQAPVDRQIKQHFMGRNSLTLQENQVDGWSLTMPGVALVASQLAKKHELSNFFVCETLLDFEKKLQEVIQSPGDLRCSMVTGSYAYPYAVQKGIAPWQHKIAIVVEKRGDRVQIALMDGDIDPPGCNASSTQQFLTIKDRKTMTLVSTIFRLR